MIRRISTDSLGKYILTCSEDKTAKLWDALTGIYLQTFRVPIGEGNDGLLYACALTPNGKFAVVGGWNRFGKNNHDIYLFSTTSGELLQRISCSSSVIYDLEFSLDGKYLAAGLGSGGVYIYEMQKNDRLNIFIKIGDYKSECYNLGFDKSGRLATVSDDGYLRIYDQNFNKVKEVQTAGGSQPYSVAFSPCNNKIAIGFYNSPVVEVYDGTSLELIYKPDISGADDPNSGFYAVAFSPDCKTLYGCYQLEKEGIWGSYIRIWNMAGKSKFADYSYSQGTIMDMKVLPDNSIIFGSSLPDIGRMKSDGSLMYYIGSETNDFSSDDKSLLQICDNGTQIGFTLNSKNKYYFSVKNKQLANNPEGFYKMKGYTDNFGGIKITDWLNSSSLKLNEKDLFLMEPNELVRCVDISHDTSAIVIGSSWNIYCTNSLGVKKWKTLTQSVVWAVNIDINKHTVAAAMADGTISWYRMSDGLLLLKLFVHPDSKRWVLYTANGYYVNSKGGDELIGWHINNGSDKTPDFYPAKNYAERYFRPDIVSEILETCKTDLEILKYKGEESKDVSKLPPRVKIISPLNNTTCFDSQTTVAVEITDQGGGIDEIVLYLNGKLVENAQFGINLNAQHDNKYTKTFNVILNNGENHITASAFNDSRTQSIADEITLNYTGQKVKSNLFILALGINQYKNPKYRLSYAVTDAESFVTEMSNGAKEIFDKVEIYFMKDTAVTRASILKEFEDFKLKVKPEDVFIFFYAGHGVMSEDNNSQFYIVPFDVTQLYNTNEEMHKVAIPANELQNFSKELKAQKQLFIFDACHSGGLVDQLALRGAAEERAIAQLARSTGTYWIAASGSQQFASEFYVLEHGLFTYTILQGLKGGADGSHDRQITVEELSTYIKHKLPEFSKQYNDEAQYPYSFGFGMDFPIFILK
jgi:WD40 repeat protein